LSVLAMAEAEGLRATVFEVMRRVGSVEAGEEAEERRVVRRLEVRELVWAGLTSNKLASVVALLLVAERLAGDIVSEETRQRYLVEGMKNAMEWYQAQAESAWLVVWAGAVLVAVVGVVLSVIGSVVMFYGFTLSLAGEDLHRAYGLFTRRASSLPRRRIPVLKVEERLLRRWCRLATLRADTAAGRQEGDSEKSGGRDVLLPVLPRREVDGLLPVFFPDWEEEGDRWRRVSRRAVRRATLKGGVGCLVLTGLSVWRQPEWWGFWPLLLLPLVYWMSVMSYRHLGYGVSSRYFQTRRGWLGRARHIVPIRNAQAVVVSQSPFDRRHGVSTLIVDTAGQAYTGGGPRVSNVPEAEALELARMLARRAAGTRYRC